MLLQIIAGLLVALAVVGVVVGAVLTLTSTQGRVNTRMREFVAGDARQSAVSVLDMRRQKRNDLFAQIGRPLGAPGRDRALVHDLARADLSLTISEFPLSDRVALRVTLVLMALVRGVVADLAMPGLLVGAWLSRALHALGDPAAAEADLDNQMPDMLNVIAGGGADGQQPVSGAGPHGPRGR